MKKNWILFCTIWLFLSSCSSTPKRESYNIAPANLGLIKNDIATFPIYLTNTLEKRSEVEKKYSHNIFIIHTGHVISPKNTKNKNEEILNSLSERGYNLVNLTLEDIATADEQGLKLDSYSQMFLNSSVVDLNTDDLVTSANIVPYFALNGMAFVGLSDKDYEKNLHTERYLITDSVLAILKAKKLSMQDEEAAKIHSFIIVHNLGKDIDEVMGRLPPNFINSLAK